MLDALDNDMVSSKQLTKILTVLKILALFLLWPEADKHRPKAKKYHSNIKGDVPLAADPLLTDFYMVLYLKHVYLSLGADLM